MKRPHPGTWLLLKLTRPPYTDALGHKGWFERFAHAQPHLVRHVALKIAGWQRTARPLRIAFLSDFHAGCHTGDVARLAAIIDEVRTHAPDLVLHGGDFVNMQPFGGGRLNPRTVAAILARAEAPLGRFAVLGNHDYTYGAAAVQAALEESGIAVLNDEVRTLVHEGQQFDVVGLPDEYAVPRGAGAALLSRLTRPAIVLAHDPYWFAHVPEGPHLTLSGHTHGGQWRFPFAGVVHNASKAPLRWTHGHVAEGGRHLYVTAGIGTSLIPLRIGVPPEYAVIEVEGAS